MALMKTDDSEVLGTVVLCRANMLGVQDEITGCTEDSGLGESGNIDITTEASRTGNLG